MLLGAGQFLGNFANQRICWIGGKLGGHKTAFSYLLAARYLERGFRLVSNNLSVWADLLKDVSLTDKGFLKAFLILDEGGLFFDTSDDVEDVAVYLSKLDCYVILPSASPPPQTTRGLLLQPVWSFRNTGVPLVMYQWRLSNLMQKGMGFFFWWRPSEIYGVYSRRDPGTNCKEIREFMQYRVTQYRRRFERSPDYSWKEDGDKDEVSAMERERREVDPTARVLADAAGTIANAAIDLEAVSKGKRRRRWRRI